MKSRETYKAIYDAALKRDEVALSGVLEDGVIGVVQKINEIKIMISPVCQLAYENNQEATTWLLKQGASKYHAVLGYAYGGHTDQVTALLKEGASIDAAVRGYAIGGHIDQVNALLKQGASIDAAVFSYAIGGHTDQVNALLKKGASKDAAVRGYAIGGHIDQVNALLKQGASIDEALKGYAYAGHTDQVNALLEKGASIDAAVLAYAFGGHTDQVNALLGKGASKNHAVFGYAFGGHTDQVNALLKKGASKDAAVRGYAYAGHPDLFTKINELKKYGETLKKQGHLHKGDNAINLAKNIHNQVIAFLSDTSNAATASSELSEIIANGKKSMGERKLKDILAHIVLALTGIGLIIILGKKFLTESKSGFLNTTKRQKILSDIDKEVYKVTKPKL